MNQDTKQSVASPTFPISPTHPPLPNSSNVYPNSYLAASASAYPSHYNNFNAYNAGYQQNWNNNYHQYQQQAAFYSNNYYSNQYNQHQNYPGYQQQPQPHHQQGFKMQSPPTNNHMMNPNKYQKHKNNFNRNNNNNTNNNNFNKNNNNNHNNKINKQDLPENNQFNCEVCDRGFKTNEMYEIHCKTHTTCGVDGCKFTAAEKLVKIHFNNFHATGIDKKIPKSLDTPEEIQKYINDRKKNFPTNNNLEKKIKLDNEKTERGCLLETRQFGRFKHNNNNNKITNEKQTDKNEPESEQANESQPPVVANSESKRFNPIDKRIKKKNKKKNSISKNNNNNNINIQRKPTLLQQLLANEIRHERNIILQCVKYVVENNFFDNKTQTITKEEKEEEEVKSNE